MRGLARAMGKESKKGKDWGDRDWGKDAGKSRGGDKGYGGKGKDSSSQRMLFGTLGQVFSNFREPVI